MPYLDTAQEWLTQSTLLLKARPSTTRITTKYTITPTAASTKPSKASKAKPKTEPDTTPAPSLPLPATLTLKTYDPTSGVTLKYSTNKAAEVSRLIQILGRLARPMAGLPEIKEELALPMIKSEEIAEGSGPGTPALESVPAVGKSAGGGQGGGQGGKKGKKKGKK